MCNGVAFTFTPVAKPPNVRFPESLHSLPRFAAVLNLLPLYTS